VSIDRAAGARTVSCAAERMRALRARRRALGLREICLIIPDAREPEFRRRIAEEVARLNPEDEEEAIRWIEAVSSSDVNDMPR
jgi:hypothetical protein